MEKSDGKQIEGKSITEDAAYKKLVEDVGEAILGIKELCRQHGIFDGLRELYKCQNCGLMEDIAFYGRLMTYHDIDTRWTQGCALRSRMMMVIAAARSAVGL